MTSCIINYMLQQESATRLVHQENVSKTTPSPITNLNSHQRLNHSVAWKYFEVTMTNEGYDGSTKSTAHVGHTHLPTSPTKNPPETPEAKEASWWQPNSKTANDEGLNLPLNEEDTPHLTEPSPYPDPSSHHFIERLLKHSQPYHPSRQYKHTWSIKLKALQKQISPTAGTLHKTKL